MAKKSPKIRLYIDAPLNADRILPLSQAHAHYLGTVMRAAPGLHVAVFNGRDGEWVSELQALNKRSGLLRCVAQCRPQATPPDVWLLFAPVKKTRTAFIVEKATELGVRRLQPVFTAHTNSDRVNVARMEANTIEAAEQCGALSVPEVMAPASLDRVLADWPDDRMLYACDERRDAPTLLTAVVEGPGALLVGPEGGFSEAEFDRLRALPTVVMASLGPRILRADTAAVAALTLWQASVGDWRDTARANHTGTARPDVACTGSGT